MFFSQFISVFARFVVVIVFVFSHCVVNTGVTNVWDARYLADSVLNSFMCRPILLLLRHIPDNSLSKIEFCLYTLHFSINDYKLVLFLSLSKKARRWPPPLPSFIFFGIEIVFLSMRLYPHTESNILSSQTSTNLQHQVFPLYMTKLEIQNNDIRF